MTGDVMEQRGPKIVIWIDRKKNIMKLSQGEFVSTGRLEATYAGKSYPKPCSSLPLFFPQYIKQNHTLRFSVMISMCAGTNSSASSKGACMLLRICQGVRRY